MDQLLNRLKQRIIGVENEEIEENNDPAPRDIEDIINDAVTGKRLMERITNFWTEP